MNRQNILWLASIFFSMLFLSGCGGSDSGNTSSRGPVITPGSPPPSTGNLVPLVEAANILIFGDSQISALSSAGFAVVPKGSNQIQSVQWTQTAGAHVNILAANSQTIGFDVPTSGSYTFNVNIQLSNGASESYSVNLSASAENANAGTIRLDHTVSELGKVSLHAGQPHNKQIDTVVWTQISGPAAQNVEPDEAFLFFDAPTVIRDEVISYSAQISYSDGTIATDDVYLTVKNVNFDTNGLFYGNNTIISEDIFAYRQNSLYKQALEQCVYNNIIPATPNCTLNDLPLIGSLTATPNVQDILDRTLVSHEWMGQRFAEYLTNSAAGQDILNMLRGVTAVVISYDIRPSFYWAATGAIYLDANSFWRTAAERDTLNDQADFRSDFGNDLQFQFFWRYVKENQYYPLGRYAKQDREERTFSDLEASVSWLMFHELAHANDFFPPTIWATINRNQTPLSYFNGNGTSSDVLSNIYPLRSDEMHSLAQVRFKNVNATESQKSLRGADVEGFFVPDIAPSFYAYLTDREDFATLVERFMMLYRLGADSDLAIIDGETSDDFNVIWGQRNRISSPSLQDRTVFAVTRVYPELGNVQTIIETLPVPLIMDNTRGWFANLALPYQSSTNSATSNMLVVDEFFGAMTKHERQLVAQKDTRDIHEGKPSLQLIE